MKETEVLGLCEQKLKRLLDQVDPSTYIGQELEFVHELIQQLHKGEIGIGCPPST